MNRLTLKEAESLLALSQKKAEESEVSVNLAVVDMSGHLIAFKRMDSALLGAIDIAIKKAKTAALFQKPSHLLGKKSLPGGPLFNIEHSNNGLITFAGGLPIKNKAGEVIAAIGVSGSSIENDLLIAQAAIPEG